MRSILYKYGCCLFTIFCIQLSAQKIKIKFSDFKYEWLPETELSPEYNKYAVHFSSDATDGIPQSMKFAYTREKYIPKLENVSEVTTQNGIISGNSLFGRSTATYGGGSPPDLLVRIILGDIVFTDKEVGSKTDSESPDPNASNYFYTLTCQFKFRLKVSDANNGKILIDTLVDNPKYLTFPDNFAISTNGTATSKVWYSSKVELNNKYNQDMRSIQEKAKMLLVKNCSGEATSILSGLYDFNVSDQTFSRATVKSKKPQFNVFDTINDQLCAIFDSISLNTKHKTHLNWHTTSLKQKAAGLHRKITNAMTNELILAEFSDNQDKVEFQYAMKLNLLILDLFQDNFSVALQSYEEISPFLFKRFDDLYFNNGLMRTSILLKRESSLYNRHKARFHFQ